MSPRPNAEIKVSLELLRMVLDLPETYRLVGVHQLSDDAGTSFSVIVCAQDLPPIPAGASRPHLVTPIYERVGTWRTCVREIRVTPALEREDVSP
jgi:hypothetical protein